MDDEVRVPINADADLVTARAEGRAMAERLGFPRPDPTLVATAISEIARNIVVHVGSGEIVLRPLHEADRYGLVVIACDDGPGIRDVEAALHDEYSGRGGLGLGLPGARRLMDEFDLESDADNGTTVTMKKWRRRDELERLRRGTPSACMSCENRSSGAWRRCAAAAKPRAVTSRSSPSCPTARSLRPSTAWGTGVKQPAPPKRPARWCAIDRAEISFCWPSAATALCGTHAGRRSAWPSFPPSSGPSPGLAWAAWKGRLLSGDRSAPRQKGSLALRSGVPGHELPNVSSATLDVRPGDVLVLATDGIAPSFADSLDISGSAQAISERILAAHGKPTDDALVVALRYLEARQ